jgi:hypothetical protein
MATVFIVECWSNSTAISPFDGSRFYEVTHAYTASSKQAARMFCKDNPDYGGVKGKHENYFPWHWVISEVPINGESMYIWREELTPTGKRRR